MVVPGVRPSFSPPRPSSSTPATRAFGPARCDADEFSNSAGRAPLDSEILAASPCRRLHGNNRRARLRHQTRAQTWNEIWLAGRDDAAEVTVQRQWPTTQLLGGADILAIEWVNTAPTPGSMTPVDTADTDHAGD
jgi:hypothetical protein